MSETQAWWVMCCAVWLGLLVAAHGFSVLVRHMDERRAEHKRELLASIVTWNQPTPLPPLLCKRCGVWIEMGADHSCRGLRILRNGKVNPKPSGPPPPVPVQVPKVRR